MAQRGGNDRISSGIICRMHSAASSCALACAVRSCFGRRGYRERTDSSFSTSSASSRRYRSPRRRPMDRKCACTSIRTAAVIADGNCAVRQFVRSAIIGQHPNVPAGTVELAFSTVNRALWLQSIYPINGNSHIVGRHSSTSHSARRSSPCRSAGERWVELQSPPLPIPLKVLPGRLIQCGARLFTFDALRRLPAALSAFQCVAFENLHLQLRPSVEFNS
jgi:hypothetical protein